MKVLQRACCVVLLAAWAVAGLAAEPADALRDEAAEATEAGREAADQVVTEAEQELEGERPARPDGHGGENPLVPDGPDLAVWTGVVFLVLLAVLWKFAWGPIVQGLDKRENTIAEQIAQAERANHDAQQLLAEYEAKLAGSQEEVRAILDQARRDADQAGRELIEKARREAAAEQQRALRQIDAATASALKELADRSAALAIDLAGRIVQAELKPEQHAALIERAVSDFAGAGPNGH